MRCTGLGAHALADRVHLSRCLGTSSPRSSSAPSRSLSGTAQNPLQTLDPRDLAPERATPH
eukprot:3865090-Rhodomonas_salina.2